MTTVKIRVGDETKMIENVTSINQSLGDATHMNARCSGKNGFPFPVWCPDCAKAKKRDGCGKLFRAFTIRGEPGDIVLNLESGEVVYADEILGALNEKGEEILF